MSIKILGVSGSSLRDNNTGTSSANSRSGSGMSEKVKLDIISDVVCPWCVIGFKRLAKAISEMEMQDKVELEWHPFELNPNMPAEGENMQDHIVHKYGMTPKQSARELANMTRIGAEIGFQFDFFPEMKMVNTRNAHILLGYAKEYGKQTELKMRLFEAFFSERKDVSDRRILTRELQSVGLDVDKALARLDDDDTRKRVLAGEAHWHNSGVAAVPTIVFNQSNRLTGAQPDDVYKQALTSSKGAIQ